MVIPLYPRSYARGHSVSVGRHFRLSRNYDRRHFLTVHFWLLRWYRRGFCPEPGVPATGPATGWDMASTGVYWSCLFVIMAKISAAARHLN